VDRDDTGSPGDESFAWRWIEEGGDSTSIVWHDFHMYFLHSYVFHGDSYILIIKLLNTFFVKNALFVSFIFFTAILTSVFNVIRSNFMLCRS
jgi:hypothetical protein